jgi:GNAT superfamily N-acetyltransferase
MPAHRLECRPATAEEENAARACLTEHAAEVGGFVSNDWSGEPFSVLALYENKVVGGLTGRIFWNWLYAGLVWVEKPFRSSGIGKDIMTRAEEKARDLGLAGIYLWTQNWQAPGFYSKLGFEQFVMFENFPPGYSRIGFKKCL